MFARLQTMSWNVGAVYLVAGIFQALILVCAIYILVFLKSVLENILQKVVSFPRNPISLVFWCALLSGGESGKPQSRMLWQHHSLNTAAFDVATKKCNVLSAFDVATKKYFSGSTYATVRFLHIYSWTKVIWMAKRSGTLKGDKGTLNCGTKCCHLSYNGAILGLWRPKLSTLIRLWTPQTKTRNTPPHNNPKYEIWSIQTKIVGHYIR